MSFLDVAPSIVAVFIGILEVSDLLKDKPKLKYLASFLLIALMAFNIYQASENSDEKEEQVKQLNTIIKSNAEFQRYLKDSLGLFRDGNKATIANQNTYNNFYYSQNNSLLKRDIARLDADIAAVRASQSRILIGDQNIDVKEQALVLAADLLKFVEQRNENHPRANINEAALGLPSPIPAQYSAATMALYKDLYERRVMEVHDLLNKSGMSNTQFNSIYNKVTEPIEIRRLGEAMAYLADKLP